MSKSKYSRDQIQMITNKIERLPAKEYAVIFEMIAEDINNQYTSSDQKVYINMSNVSDGTLDKISERLAKIKQPEPRKVAPRRTTRPKKEKVHQWSNYEKSLLRSGQANQKEYEEFSYSSL